MLPHVGVVGLGVLVLDPSRRSGDGDEVENNGEEQEQGQDPPAAGVGDPTAEHGRRWTVVADRVRGGKETTELRVITKSTVVVWLLSPVKPTRYKRCPAQVCNAVTTRTCLGTGVGWGCSGCAGRPPPGGLENRSPTH